MPTTDNSVKPLPELEYSIYLSEERDIHTALTAAIDDFFAQYMSLPDEVLCHLLRRLELPCSEWHVLYHGAIPIRLRSPHDKTLAVNHPRDFTRNSFICVRVVPAPS